jgi:hypothetical protein
MARYGLGLVLMRHMPRPMNNSWQTSPFIPTTLMMKKYWICLALLFPAIGANSQSVDRQTAQDEAYGTYFRCMNVYASRYVKSDALVADIADAAMSACQDRYQDLLNATASLLGGMTTAQTTLKDVRETARSFAVRTVLEARFPLR